MAQETNTVWKNLISENGTIRDYVYFIEKPTQSGTSTSMYSDNSIVSNNHEHTLFDEFGIGNASCASLKLCLYSTSDIPRGSIIKQYVQLKNGDTVSQYLQKGIFYINRRTHDDDYWEIEAFDAMRKADVEWNASAYDGLFPMSMKSAVLALANEIGVRVDSRTKYVNTFKVDYPPTGATIRDELRYIAAAAGGNFIISDTGKLLLIPLGSELDTGAALFDIGLDVIDYQDTGQMLPVSRVTLMVDDDHAITAGDDTGYEIVADCPHATQSAVNAILNRLSGYVYHSYTADAANLDPAAELGDAIHVGNVESLLCRVTDNNDGYPDIAAPGSAALEEEYPSEGPVQKTFNRKLAETRAEISKTADTIGLSVESIRGDVSQLSVTTGNIQTIVSNQSDQISEIQQFANTLTLSVSESGQNSTITLSANGAEISSGTITITGDLVVRSDLTDGVTTISGDNIKTGSITLHPDYRGRPQTVIGVEADRYGYDYLIGGIRYAYEDTDDDPYGIFSDKLYLHTDAYRAGVTPAHRRYYYPSIKLDSAGRISVEANDSDHGLVFIRGGGGGVQINTPVREASIIISIYNTQWEFTRSHLYKDGVQML